MKRLAWLLALLLVSATAACAGTDGGGEGTDENGDEGPRGGRPDPNGTDPGPTDPGPTDPGPTDPGPTDPGPTDPGPTDPGPTDPGPTDPRGTALPGDACAIDDDCAEGFCMTEHLDGEATGFLGGYCLSQCDTTACPGGSSCWSLAAEQPPVCLADCDTSDDCRPGYMCDMDAACWPGCDATNPCPAGSVCSPDGICAPGEGPVDPGPSDELIPGTACTADEDCGDNGFCVLENIDGEATGFVGGYCLTSCETSECPTGSTCFLLGADQLPLCIRNCGGDSDCRGGYMCDADDTCWPGCDATHACPGDMSCVPDGFCAGEGTLPEPDPVVPSDCEGDTFEPNDSRAEAEPLPLGTTLSSFRCAGESDWYRVDVPANQLVNVLFTLPNTVDLDVFAYRADGTTRLGGRVEGAEPSPSWSKDYETIEEGFGFYTGDTAGTYYVRVSAPSSGAAGGYTVRATATEWEDGVSCRGVGFTNAECIGGSAGNQTLWSFPFADAADDYAGYVFDSVSNYRYLRRETMMAIRYAIHEVEREFPGTNPLGLIDMCQRDGITPGYDVDYPRHPESTHDQGGNIDVAYYQTVSDNHARTVCDENGGSVVSGPFCANSAVNTHIVDLERNVYFVIALTRTGRLRVVGLDRVIGPLMLDAADAMRDAGDITNAEYNAFEDHVVWGDGWPSHQHHMHVSMEWL